MSENIEGGIYGVEIDADVANSLVIDESPSDPVEAAPSEPNGEEAAVEAETQETEQLSTTEEAPVIEELEVDGKSYSYDEIQAAIEDSRNRHDWQKSNTEKAQELSAQRKALDAQSNKWKALNDDDELVETLKDYLGADHDLFKESVTEPSKALEQNTETQEANDGVSSRVEELENKLEMQEAQRAVEQDIGQLLLKHPELDGQEDALKEVLQTSIDKGMTNLEDAFILTHHEATVDSAFAKAVKTLEEANAKKSIPEVSAKHSGTRSESNTKPLSYDEAREMALKGYDLYE